jgi:peroxin-19
VLDDFAAKPGLSDKPAASGPGRPRPQEQSAKTAESELDEDALLKQLEAGMAELMGAGAPSVTEAAGESDWDALTQQLTENGVNPTDLVRLLMGDEAKADSADKGPRPETDASAAASKGEESFQETIRKTVERMQASGEKATAAASGDGGGEGEGGDDMLAQLLKAMESGLLAGSGEGDDDNLDKIFMGIMEQLSNKEMLYEPMKELHGKFGPWLKDNRDKVSEEKRERYELQASIVGEIVAKFDEDGYADENPEHKSYIWERMQKVGGPFIVFHVYLYFHF